jgi:hypothetical protein
LTDPHTTGMPIWRGQLDCAGVVRCERYVLVSALSVPRSARGRNGKRAPTATVEARITAVRCSAEQPRSREGPPAAQRPIVEYVRFARCLLQALTPDAGPLGRHRAGDRGCSATRLPDALIGRSCRWPFGVGAESLSPLPSEQYASDDGVPVGSRRTPVPGRSGTSRVSRPSAAVPVFRRRTRGPLCVCRWRCRRMRSDEINANRPASQLECIDTRTTGPGSTTAPRPAARRVGRIRALHSARIVDRRCCDGSAAHHRLPHSITGRNSMTPSERSQHGPRFDFDVWDRLDLFMKCSELGDPQSRHHRGAMSTIRTARGASCWMDP